MPKILLIDECHPDRENTRNMLTNAGFEVMEASSGAIGRESASRELPDLILCEVSQNGLDGYQLLKNLRSQERTCAIPFIFLTSLDSKPALREAMELGADDYLTKPVTPPELLKAIFARLDRQKIYSNSFQKKLTTLSANLAQSLPHELNTPLSIILMSVEILESEQLIEAEKKAMCRMLKTSAHRLQSLIEKYLLFSELEILWARQERNLQKPEKMLAEQSVATLLRELAVKQAGSANRVPDLILDLAGLDNRHISLTMNDKWFKRLVDELLFNAFQYSRAGQPVTVKTGFQNGDFILSINDKGHGMTPEQIAGIGAYVQFDRKIHEQRGFGLGLIIVKRLAELHGGRFTIESWPGHQTTVTVMLPVDNSPDPIQASFATYSSASL